jgi:integrase
MAQLVARLHGMQKVRGSNPLSSTRSEARCNRIKIIREQNGEQEARHPLIMGGHAASARRRGHNEGSIYKDEAKGRWYGAVSFGYGPDGKTWRRHKVSGRTRAEVVEKLKQLQAERDSGVQPEHAYTVQRAVDDWLAEGLDGRSAKTVRLNHDVLKLGQPACRAPRGRAGRHPKGQPGRPSKALTAEQAAAVLKGAEGSRLGAYVVLCLMTGIRTEEARALRWDHVNLDARSIAVRRSVRLGGDTKTSKSRWTLGLPQAVTEALREHRVRQDDEKAAAGELWTEHNLVFASALGTELDAANVRRSFKSICKTAGIGEDWTPRELRTSFVSLLSASGVPVEEIARLAGHSSSRTTEVIYRKELRPVLVKGAEVMDQIFG